MRWRERVLGHLPETEVRRINFVVPSPDWNICGDGPLFIPDPRALSLGETVMWGEGRSGPGAMGAFGRRPWDKDSETETQTLAAKPRSLRRFQSEFTKRFGPRRRGGREAMHEYYLAGPARSAGKESFRLPRLPSTLLGQRGV
jgi:hypothetical protein